MTGRWYCVDKEGLAMLCYDRKDAQASVAENDKAWPRNAPHQAVRLGDIDAAKREADRLRRELADMTVERDILRRDNANMRASVHTCGPTCAMAGCVNARLREALRTVLSVWDDSACLVPIEFEAAIDAARAALGEA